MAMGFASCASKFAPARVLVATLLSTDLILAMRPEIGVQGLHDEVQALEPQHRNVEVPSVKQVPHAMQQQEPSASESPVDSQATYPYCLTLLPEGKGCNTVKDKETCMTSRDGRSGVPQLDQFNVYQEPCVACGFDGNQCGFGNSELCEPEAWLRGMGKFRSGHQIAVCPELLPRGPSKVTAPSACAKDTGGSCGVFSCAASRHAACDNGRCMCGEGFCANDGACIVAPSLDPPSSAANNTPATPPAPIDHAEPAPAAATPTPAPPPAPTNSEPAPAAANNTAAPTPASTDSEPAPTQQPGPPLVNVSTPEPEAEEEAEEEEEEDDVEQKPQHKSRALATSPASPLAALAAMFLVWTMAVVRPPI